MTYPDARHTYINCLLAFQGRMGLTNAKMAELLGLSLRQYERFIAGEPIQREFDLIMRVYELSGQMMYKMTGAAVPREVENSQLYSQFTEDNKQLADAMMRTIYENQLNK